MDAIARHAMGRSNFLPYRRKNSTHAWLEMTPAYCTCFKLLMVLQSSPNYRIHGHGCLLSRFSFPHSRPRRTLAWLCHQAPHRKSPWSISSLKSLPCSWFTLNPVPANYTKQIQANSSCMMYSILTAKGASYSHYACIWGQLGSCTCEIDSWWGFWPMSEDCRSCDSGSELRICLMKRRAVSNQVFTNRQPHGCHALQVYNLQETCTCKSQ